MPETSVFVRQGDGRQIAVALGLSVGIHVLILFLVPGLREWVEAREPESPPLVARLREVRPASASAATETESPLPAPENALPPERVPARAVPMPVPAPVPVPTVQRPPEVSIAPAPLASAVAPMEEEPARWASLRTEPAPVVRSDRSLGVPGSASVPAPGAEALDPASIGQYRNAIIAAAKRYRKYPRVAIENNWEGRAEVRLSIDANGAIASISIRTGSGYEALDRQALEMIRKAKPAAPMPPALRGKGFVLDLPVLFSLKEETG